MLNRARCLLALLALLSAYSGRAQAQSTVQLTGAGATFPAPLYDKWFASYAEKHSNVQITYRAIGSEAGVRDLLAGKVDFGASDNPQILHQLAPGSENLYLLLPSVVGAVVPIVNLPGLVKDISLTPQALAAIYSGKITKWNDPALKATNHGVPLPDLDIVVVHRSDGSGTSYAWTDFLSETNPDWKAQVGMSLDPKWPVGRGAAANDGVAKMVKELGGSIGYVEYYYAWKNHLSFARVENQAGEFIAADLQSIAAAVANAAPLSDSFEGSIANSPGKQSYPIVSFTWLVLPIQIKNENKRLALMNFFDWMLDQGQKQASALGYMPLPANLVAREADALAKLN